MQTEAADFAQPAYRLSIEFGAHRLGGIFDNRNSLFFSHRKKFFHPRGLPGQMHGNDRFGFRGNGARYCRGIKVQVFEDIRELGSRARKNHTTGAGEVRIWGRNDFVSRTDTKAFERQNESVCAGVETYGVLRLAESGEFLLKLFRLLAEDELA